MGTSVGGSHPVRRAVPVTLAFVLLIAGCAFVMPEHEPTPASVVLVGQGHVDGSPWVVTAYVDGTMLCMDKPLHEESGCHSPIEPPSSPIGPSTVPGDSFPASARPMVVAGLVRRDVARIEIESDAGTAEGSIACLESIGVPACAYAVAFPAGSRVTSFTAFAADGTVLQQMPW